MNLDDTAEVTNAAPPSSEVQRPADLPAAPAPAAPIERKYGTFLCKDFLLY